MSNKMTKLQRSVGRVMLKYYTALEMEEFLGQLWLNLQKQEGNLRKLSDEELDKYVYVAAKNTRRQIERENRKHAHAPIEKVEKSAPEPVNWRNLSGYDKKVNGAIGEMAVCLDLARRGWLVYRCIWSSTVDILAMDVDGRVIRVEVKTGCKAMSEMQKKLADVLAVYDSVEDRVTYTVLQEDDDVREKF